MNHGLEKPCQYFVTVEKMDTFFKFWRETNFQKHFNIVLPNMSKPTIKPPNTITKLPNDKPRTVLTTKPANAPPTVQKTKPAVAPTPKHDSTMAGLTSAQLVNKSKPRYALLCCRAFVLFNTASRIPAPTVTGAVPTVSANSTSSSGSYIGTQSKPTAPAATMSSVRRLVVVFPRSLIVF